MKILIFVCCLAFTVLSHAGPIIRDTELYVRSGENNMSVLSLEHLRGSQVDEKYLTIKVSVKQAKSLKGYGLVLHYSTEKYEFVEALQDSESFLNAKSENRSVFAVSHKVLGRVNVSGMSSEENGYSGNGKLVEFVLKPLGKVMRSPTIADFRLTDCILIDLYRGVNSVASIETVNLKDVPLKFALDRNIPNPFNPNTSISYQLPETALVKLVIYNVLGQEVRVLVKEVHEAGVYTVVWDGKDNLDRQVASGVYAYRIVAGDFTYSRRMILLK